MTSTGKTALPRPRLTIVPAKAGLPLLGGEVDLLVNVAVDLPALEVDRPPLSLALVIDRSGSMSGAPLEAAKRAAALAVGMLVPGDWVSVVAFDDAVTLVRPLVRVGDDRRELVAAIGGIRAGGSTNLYGGWAEGLTQALACPESEIVARVVLLSDGMANAGVTDRGQIAKDITAAAGHGVTTTTMGLGRNYDEDLLQLMADAGHGNYVFLESDSVVTRAFEQEVAGLSALRGRGARLAASPVGGAKLRFADADGARLAGLRADASGLVLPDLIANLPGDYLVTLQVASGPIDVSLTLHWEDVLTGAHDEQTVELGLPWLGSEAYGALQVDGRVQLAWGLARVAAIKRQLAVAARTGNHTELEKLMPQLARLVASLPEGEERRREEAELANLERYMARRDHAMAAKEADWASRRNQRGFDDMKMAHMRDEEREYRARKEALYREHLAARAAQTNRELLDSTLPGGHKRVQVVRGDITQQAVDAVVNSTSRALFGVGGVDGALARAGGQRHLLALRDIGSIDFGQAVFTPGFGIPARFVIHTAAQPWAGGGEEVETLKRCYAAVFALAEQLGVRSIALPAIGTGRYQFPVALAVGIAVDAARDALAKGQLEIVRFVAFDDRTGDEYLRALNGAWQAA